MNSNFIKIKSKPKSDKPTPKRDDWKRKRRQDRRDVKALKQRNVA